MLAPEEAWRRIADLLPPKRTGRRTRRAALGRILAKPLVAGTEVPAADVSAMDGFAYAGDLPAGAELEVALTVAAGDPPGRHLLPGRAARIWTGAPVPDGADRVVPIEQTAPAGPERLRLLDSVPSGNAIRRRAEILAAGDLLLAPGDRLGPAAFALLASQGIDEVDVHEPPRVALLATGDEVVPAELEPAPGQLRDSHSDYLLAAGRRLGLELTSLGIAPDAPDEIERRLRSALDDHDVLLVCGGVSMGERDHTEAAFAALGAEIVFERVAVQPGKPLVFAHRGDRLLFGLPGNPASVMVTFRLFVRPALARLAGGRDAFWSDARVARLDGELPAGRARDRFVPASVVADAAPGEVVRPLAVRGSHDLVSFARADRLIRIRADDPARANGEPVELVEWE
jgi:molybdopterin molybdotransferase